MWQACDRGHEAGRSIPPPGYWPQRCPAAGLRRGRTTERIDVGTESGRQKMPPSDSAAQVDSERYPLAAGRFAALSPKRFPAYLRKRGSVHSHRVLYATPLGKEGFWTAH
jgi:hypothetical protein